MNDALIIRKASRAEFATAIGWAAAEGWNPGIDDLEAFHAADPDGFLMGWIGNTPVSSISVVRYAETFGFLGFYIVREDRRGTGVGLATWNAGMARLAGCAVALDGVLEQQANYEKSGFSHVGRNIRYSGVPDRDPGPGSSIVVRTLKREDLPQVLALDRTCFYASRVAFMTDWCLSGPLTHRRSLIAVSDGQVAGFGTIRKCQTGYKIGPLFAGDPKAANTLFSSLVDQVEPTSAVVLDVPQCNADAVALAETMGLEPVFETARMLRGQADAIRWDSIYGITSFELG